MAKAGGTPVSTVEMAAHPGPAKTGRDEAADPDLPAGYPHDIQCLQPPLAAARTPPENAAAAKGGSAFDCFEFFALCDPGRFFAQFASGSSGLRPTLGLAGRSRQQDGT